MKRYRPKLFRTAIQSRKSAQLNRAFNEYIDGLAKRLPEYERLISALNEEYKFDEVGVRFDELEVYGALGIHFYAFRYMLGRKYFAGLVSIEEPTEPKMRFIMDTLQAAFDKRYAYDMGNSDEHENI